MDENKEMTVEEKLAELTPTQYFDLLKDMKKTITDEDIENVLNNCLELAKKPKLTGQKKMAKKIYNQAQIILKESMAVKAGFNIYVLREDILYYIENIAKKVVKIIELENYERDIPDEVCDKIVQAQPYFDEFFVVFTDYTGEAERTIAKEKRDKDPILFGCIHHPERENIPTNRMYFIADWVDEYCDLTLEELCLQYEGNMKCGMIHKNMIPTTLDELKEAFEFQENESNDNKIRVKDLNEISSSVIEGRVHKAGTDDNKSEKPKKTATKTTTKKPKTTRKKETSKSDK